MQFNKGFGDGLEGSGSWKACVKYIDDQVIVKNTNLEN